MVTAALATRIWNLLTFKTNFNMAEVIGYLKKIYEPVEGDSKTTGNHWTKQDFLLESGGQYSEDMGFTVWNCKADLRHPIGAKLKVSFSIRSEERLSQSNNVFLATALTAYKIERVEQATPQFAPVPAASKPVETGVQTQPVQPAAPQQTAPPTYTNDLPF